MSYVFRKPVDFSLFIQNHKDMETMKCPACGFDQPQDVFCAKCGTSIQKYRSGFAYKFLEGLKTPATQVSFVIFALLGAGYLLFFKTTPHSAPQSLSQSIFVKTKKQEAPKAPKLQRQNPTPLKQKRTQAAITPTKVVKQNESLFFQLQWGKESSNFVKLNNDEEVVFDFFGQLEDEVWIDLSLKRTGPSSLILFFHYQLQKKEKDFISFRRSREEGIKINVTSTKTHSLSLPSLETLSKENQELLKGSPGLEGWTLYEMMENPITINFKKEN